MKTNDIILRLGLSAALILLVILSALQMIPPSAVPADAPPTKFSAGRAMMDLQVVAAEPHAAGSEAQARVRTYIIEQVEALGLRAITETSGRVTNILVRLPGTDSTRTVLVTGHYDSHPPAPGAGDDGLSTVAMLEAIRVLSVSPYLRNDILFLFTDGEELGWLGSLSYLIAHPEAKNQIALVLCFDGRPGNGPLVLWETSPNDAWMVREMMGVPLSLYTGSWYNRVERGERDTDFSIFSEAGFTGVEIESAEVGTRYHTPRDIPQAISPGLLQAFGHTMLALTRHFGSIDLAIHTADHDLAFFSVPLLGLVAYPAWLMSVLSGLGLLVLLVLVIVAWRSGQFSFKRFAWSLLTLLLGMVLIVLSVQLVWSRVKQSHINELITLGGFEASTAWITNLMVVGVILMAFLLVVLSRKLGGIHLLPAQAVLYLLIWFVVYFLMDADNPLTEAYIVLPFLGGVLGMFVLLFVKNQVWKGIILAFSALLVLVLSVPQMWLATFTREDAWIPVLAACILVGFFAPQIETIFERSSKLGSQEITEILQPAV
jgi:hypothetical protein